MATIEERARKYAKGEGINNAIGGWEDMADAYIAGATEQDRIARAEEKEKCIKAAIEWNCNYCEEHTKNWDNNECYFCGAPKQIRKAMEGGEG